MPKNNPLRKSRTAEDEDEQGHAADAYWMSEEDRETESADSDEEETERAEADEDQRAHSELYRAGKIDAYLHYLKMRPQVRESEPVTLRRSVPVRERPRYRSAEEDEDREVRLYGYQPRTIRHPSPRAPRLSSRQPRRSFGRDIAIVASLSLVVAGVTGLIVYDRTSGGTIGQAVATRLSGLWSAPSVAAPPAEATKPAPVTLANANPEPITATPVPAAPASKKPVAIAELDVEDASGMASSLIPLSLRADSGVPGQSLALRLSGLPENASLTAGTRVSESSWVLRAGEEQGVKLVVPSNVTGQFAISVEALEARTGDLAAPVREINVSVNPAATATVEPAAAPASITRNFNLPAVKPDAGKPAIAQPIAATGPIATAPVATGTLSAGPPKPDSAMPIPAPIEKTSMIQADQSQELLHSGDKLMGFGELIAARQFYAKALERGALQAALKLGQTYDPAVFADKNVQGLKPDPAMAMKYYLQAQASGVADAQKSINSLEAWMQR